MSANIIAFKSMHSDDKEGDLLVTAFSGGIWGASIQFGIQTKNSYSFCRLSETQLERLIEVVAKRLNYERNFTSSGKERNEICRPKKVRRIK